MNTNEVEAFKADLRATLRDLFSKPNDATTQRTAYSAVVECMKAHGLTPVESFIVSVGPGDCDQTLAVNISQVEETNQ